MPRKKQTTDILLSSKVHKYLVTAAARCTLSHAKPHTYFLAKEPITNIIVDIKKISKKEYTGGCREMPSINSSTISQQYVEFAKKGLILCGLARLSNGFNSGGYIERVAGGPGAFQSGDALLTVMKGKILAAVGVDRHFGTVKYLEVGISDKFDKPSKNTKKSIPKHSKKNS